MATVYGVIPEGFRRKTIDEIIADCESGEKAGLGEDFDVSAESLAGQLNGAFGRELGIAWESLETLYGAFDPDAAEGRLLDNLAKLTGSFREGSTPSTVLLTCDLDMGTTLTPSTHFAAIENQTDVRWTPSALLYPSGYVAPSSGPQSVTFLSELKGPIEGFAGTINVISTPVVGWNSVVNPNDAEAGLLTDLDPKFRARRERELAAQGSATARAVTAAVSQAFFDNLESLFVYENEGDVVDPNGVPPHSLEVVIFDGETPTIDNNSLAQIIFNAKAGGIQSYGNTLASASALVQGSSLPKPVRFSRAEQVDVYLTIDLTKTTAYAGDVAAKESLVAICSARFLPGSTVVTSIVESFAAGLAGAFDVTSVKLGLAPSPTGTANLPMTVRQVPRFSTSRIIINSTNAVGT